MKRTQFFFLSLSLVFAFGAGCSKKTVQEDVVTDGDIAELPPITDAGTDAVPMENVENIAPQDAALESPPAVEEARTDLAVTTPAEPEAAPMAAAPSQDTSHDTSSGYTSSTSATATSMGAGDYTVQSGDTLMRIAFEKYGDIYKWRSIYEANRDQIRDPNHIPPGLVLKLDGGDATSVASHDGEEKRQIRSGETLGSISWDIYGTQSHWKRLWENNRDLIKDPNRIFAGFNLYYTITPEERGEAERLKQGGQPPVVRKAPLARRHRRAADPGVNSADDAGQDEYSTKEVSVPSKATSAPDTGGLEEPPATE